MTTSHSELKTVYDDPEYYAKIRSVYHKYSSIPEGMTKWKQNVFPEEIVTKLGKGLANEVVRMLGVGSGTGEVDCDMITHIQTKFPKIHNTVLEPAPNYIEKYKQLATSRGFVDVDWEWHQQGLDEFCEEWKRPGSEAKKYHFISTIQSLYYVDDAENALMNMYEMLEDGGIMLIILLAGDSGFDRIWRKFPKFTEKAFRCLVLSDTVRDVLTNKGIKYESTKYPARADVTSCFLGTEEGNYITDFISRVINLKESVSANELKDFYDYMGGPECSIREGDNILLCNMWETIVVKK